MDAFHDRPLMASGSKNIRGEHRLSPGDHPDERLRAARRYDRELFIHMRAIRKITIHQDNREVRSITDHLRIVEAWKRATRMAERLAREHTLGLAAHAERDGGFLDQ